MMQKLFLLFLAAIATGAEASWGEKSNEDWYKDCPQSETNKYSEECYKATCPPPFVCDKMTPDEWVEKALESYPRCCGDDLTECKCPVKDVWPPFKAKIGDYCAKVEICEPSATDKSVPSSTSGDVSFLRGGGVEDVNEQIQRKEMSP